MEERQERLIMSPGRWAFHVSARIHWLMGELQFKQWKTIKGEKDLERGT